jgi:uncharacterized membrane protein
MGPFTYAQYADIASSALEAKLTMAASKSSRTRSSKPAPVRSSPTHSATAVRASSASRTSARTGTATGTTAGTTAATAAGTGRPKTDVQEAPTASRTALAPLWLQWTTLVLALVGLGASTFLTYQHFTYHAGSAFLGCSDNGFINCGKVTTSAESYFLGIPVALLGLLFYVFMVPVMSPWAWRVTRWSLRLGGRTVDLARWLPIVRVVAICVGICMVLWLIYAELFKIDNLCIYCTTVHIATFLLFVLTLTATALWGLNPNREEY